MPETVTGSFGCFRSALLRLYEEIDVWMFSMCFDMAL